ncbi:MAG: hypothetical protein WC477_04825 [Patescibacteria group bacterium]
MGLNHILDTARRLGIPVVITNERGESPQVVMPFDDFASMVGMASPKEKTNRPRISPQEATDDEIAKTLADLAFEDMERQLEREVVPSESEEEVDEEVREEVHNEVLEDGLYFGQEESR